MGQVYRATDTKLKRRVTIKILSPSLAADHDRPARFQREAEKLALLNHPNIAAIDGLEDSGDITALVMELVEGDDLSNRVARGAMLRAGKSGKRERPDAGAAVRLSDDVHTERQTVHRALHQGRHVLGRAFSTLVAG